MAPLEDGEVSDVSSELPSSEPTASDVEEQKSSKSNQNHENLLQKSNMKTNQHLFIFCSSKIRSLNLKPPAKKTSQFLRTNFC
jgi:hypothetical protein